MALVLLDHLFNPLIRDLKVLVITMNLDVNLSLLLDLGISNNVSSRSTNHLAHSKAVQCLVVTAI